MFLANKNNIKEVLLFPAMKPTDDQLASSRKNARKKAAAHATVMGTGQLQGVNLATEEGMNKIDDALQGKVFLNGNSPTKEDADMLGVVDTLPPRSSQSWQMSTPGFSPVSSFHLKLQLRGPKLGLIMWMLEDSWICISNLAPAPIRGGQRTQSPGALGCYGRKESHRPKN